MFREEKRDLAPTRAFARALLGTVDPATKDDIDKNPDAVAAGDLVGHGGLQQRYDTALRGTAGQSVVIARKAPDGNGRGHPAVQHRAGAGKPVKTTLDVTTQNAADAALAAREAPARWSRSGSATARCWRRPTAPTAAR